MNLNIIGYLESNVPFTQKSVFLSCKKFPQLIDSFSTFPDLYNALPDINNSITDIRDQTDSLSSLFL